MSLLPTPFEKSLPTVQWSLFLLCHVSELHHHIQVLFPLLGITLALTYCWATSLAALLQHFLNAFYVHECFVLMRNRKGHQITLQTVVSHHLGAGN